MREFFYKTQIGQKFLDRPWYGYNVYQAAKLAERLHIPEIAVIEFGVATGRGLLCIEKHVEAIEKFSPVKFHIYGFDTGGGLPTLEGYKDLAHHWKAGMFTMDVEGLQKKLKRAKLILGNVRETVPQFLLKHTPPPIACVLFDVDLYSSTRDALALFHENHSAFLPRVRTYFDDILGNELSLNNEFLGEKCAISEFNHQQESIKIAQVAHLQAKSIRYKWYSKCYATHFFEHPLYEKYIGRS